MKPLIIIGAGGHGRVVADIARACGYDSISFLDDRLDSCAVGKVSDYLKYIENSEFVVAVGDNSVREKLQAQMISNGCRFATLVHPSAVLGSNVTIGEGTAVMAGAVINTGAIVGKGVIINTCSSVDHDCIVSDFAHISVGAHIAGTVSVGECAFIGAGATVINNIKICDNCIIGAGAVVVKDILINGKYIGVPARCVE